MGGKIFILFINIHFDCEMKLDGNIMGFPLREISVRYPYLVSFYNVFKLHKFSYLSLTRVKWPFKSWILSTQ